MPATADPTKREAALPDAPHGGPVTLINSFIVDSRRDDKFYDMLTELAKRLTGSANLLHELFQSPTELDTKVTRIKALEHEAGALGQLG